MALETWLTKVKSAISTSIDSVKSISTMNSSDASASPVTVTVTKKSTTNILAFEIATLMSKLLHLWRSLSDPQIHRLRHETILLEGVRKVVSDDDAFLLGLACAEFCETLRHVAEFVANLSKKCLDQQLRQFDPAFKKFSHSGVDSNRWVMSWKEMDSKAKKMDRLITATTNLYKEMDELYESERGLKKMVQSCQYLKGTSSNSSSACKITTIAEIQQKIFWKKQEIKYLKQTSIWGTTFDTAMSLLARSSFTILARIKHVFGITTTTTTESPPIPRSLSVSAVVYPSSETPPKQDFMSGPLVTKEVLQSVGLLELSSMMLVPPESTLGASALALHYANVIIVIEKMIKMPRAVGPEARDDLYGMLPASVRGLLRRRLRGVGWGAARDVGLAGEWRAALERIVEWLGPVASNTVRWQGERSIERRRTGNVNGGNSNSNGNGNGNGNGNVMLLQTLYFANREKVEAAIAELLVGLNYVWRFEMEMGALEGFV